MAADSIYTIPQLPGPERCQGQRYACCLLPLTNMEAHFPAMISQETPALDLDNSPVDRSQSFFSSPGISMWQSGRCDRMGGIKRFATDGGRKTQLSRQFMVSGHHSEDAFVTSIEFNVKSIPVIRCINGLPLSKQGIWQINLLFTDLEMEKGS